MVTDAMIEAGATVIEEKARFFDEQALAKMVYTAMHEARPTADLGEDGELIARLRQAIVLLDGNPADTLGAPFCMHQVIDRLILYREALEAVLARNEAYETEFMTAELEEQIRDVLSRSA